MDEGQRQELNRRAMVEIEVRHTGRSTEGWNREGETPGMDYYRAVAGMFSGTGHAPAPAPAVAAVPPGHEVVSAALLQAATDFRAPMPVPTPAPAPAPAWHLRPRRQSHRGTNCGSHLRLHPPLPMLQRFRTAPTRMTQTCSCRVRQAELMLAVFQIKTHVSSDTIVRGLDDYRP
jgi:hypothetical protein